MYYIKCMKEGHYPITHAKSTFKERGVGCRAGGIHVELKRVGCRVHRQYHRTNGIPAFKGGGQGCRAWGMEWYCHVTRRSPEFGGVRR